jgi:hypothetical protein
MQTTIASASTLTPNPNINGRGSPLPVSSASSSANPSRSKGLQLGGNKAPASTLAAQLAEEVANEAVPGSSRLWNDDLIDIHADEGDWSSSFDIEDHTRQTDLFFIGAFESAPPTVESKVARATDGLGFGLSLRASSPSMCCIPLHDVPTD